MKLNKYIYLITILLVVPAFALSGPVIEKGNINSGSNSSSSQGYSLEGSLSQSGAGGSGSNSYSSQLGFWYLNTYKIVAAAGPGGKIEPSGEQALNEGDNITFKFTPDEGYNTSKVLIDGINDPVAVQAGEYTFENIQSDHTIDVTFLKSEFGFTQKLLLWLDPLSLGLNDAEPVSLWLNTAPNPMAGDAKMNDEARQPVLSKEPEEPVSVRFAISRGLNGHGWGGDDVMEIDYSPNVTSSNDITNFSETPKSLIVVFRTESSNQRQVLFEAGETTSGFNIYTDNDFICFGIWNRIERIFLHTQISIGYIMSNNFHLAHLQFDGDLKIFTAFLDGWSVSPGLPFSGLTKDPDDLGPSVGIGGEVMGTRFHDYNIRTSNYASTFDGFLGDIMLFNNALASQDLTEIYSYLSDKYSEAWAPPEDFSKSSGEWKIYYEMEQTSLETEAHPNPFSSRTSFSFNLPDEQEAKVDLLDLSGRLVKSIYTGKLEPGVHEFTIDGSKLDPGVYIYKVSGERLQIAGRVVLSR